MTPVVTFDHVASHVVHTCDHVAPTCDHMAPQGASICTFDHVTRTCGVRPADATSQYFGAVIDPSALPWCIASRTS